MTEDELQIADAVNSAEDRTAERTMDGHHMTRMDISSVTVGKRLVYTYDLAGGEVSAYVEDL